MTDAVISEIRRTREEFARQCNFDLHQMCVELRREQEFSEAPVVSFSKKATQSNIPQPSVQIEPFPPNAVTTEIRS